MRAIAITERVRSRSTGAVVHARYHEQPEERLRLRERLRGLLRLRRRDAVVVVDRVLRLDDRVRPAVVHEQLPAAVLEGTQVRAHRVEDRGEDEIDVGHVAGEVVRLPEPRRAEYPLEQGIELRLGR